MIKVLTEQEWFEEYYPKEWGDYTKEYNIGEYRKNPRKSGCSWMCYGDLGFVFGENEHGIMKVQQYEDTYQDTYHFLRIFVQCSEDDGFIQPYHQPKDNTYYSKVVMSKEESNLELWSLYVVGCDDSSYTKHFIGYRAARECLEDLLEYGIQIINQKDSGWFFTN